MFDRIGEPVYSLSVERILRLVEPQTSLAVSQAAINVLPIIGVIGLPVEHEDDGKIGTTPVGEVLTAEEIIEAGRVLGRVLPTVRRLDLHRDHARERLAFIHDLSDAIVTCSPELSSLWG